MSREDNKDNKRETLKMLLKTKMVLNKFKELWTLNHDKLIHLNKKNLSKVNFNWINNRKSKLLVTRIKIIHKSKILLHKGF